MAKQRLTRSTIRIGQFTTSEPEHESEGPEVEVIPNLSLYFLVAFFLVVFFIFRDLAFTFFCNAHILVVILFFKVASDDTSDNRLWLLFVGLLLTWINGNAINFENWDGTWEEMHEKYDSCMERYDGYPDLQVGCSHPTNHDYYDHLLESQRLGYWWFMIGTVFCVAAFVGLPGTKEGEG